MIGGQRARVHHRSVNTVYRTDAAVWQVASRVEPIPRAPGSGEAARRSSDAVLLTTSCVVTDDAQYTESCAIWKRKKQSAQ